MSNLFNGLESMGLQGLENVKIYDDEPKKTDNKAEKTKTPEVTEADYLFDKTYKCPVCEKELIDMPIIRAAPILTHSPWERMKK